MRAFFLLRTMLLALAGAGFMGSLMMLALTGASPAAPSIPISAGACLDHGTPLLGYVVLALVAAAIATAALKFMRRDRLHALGLLAMVLLAFGQSALAADGSTLVNVSPVAETGLWMINAILVPVLGWIGTMLFKKLKLDRIMAEAAMNKMLHAGLQRSVDAFEGLIRDQIFKDGKTLTVDVHSEAVAAVANRMIELSPDLLKRLGVTEERLQQLAAETIAARSIAAQSALAA